MLLDEADSTFMERTYHSSIMKADLIGSPDWNDEQSPPPLSAKKASEIAIATLESKLGHDPHWLSERGWGILRVELVKVPDAEKALWFYRVKLYPLVPGTGGVSVVTVFITLGGKVIPLFEKK